MIRTRLASAALLAVVAIPVLLPAQAAPVQPAPAGRNGWALLLSSGALVPTGAQRDAIGAAHLSTAQLSYVMRPHVAVTALVGWARSRDLTRAGDPKLDVFTVDAGIEARASRMALSRTTAFTPFVGVGAGSRSYNHRSVDLDAAHGLAGYAAAGGELAKGRVRLRAELRDYVSRFQPPGGGGAGATRNDLVVLVGLRLARRGS